MNGNNGHALRENDSGIEVVRIQFMYFLGKLEGISAFYLAIYLSIKVIRRTFHSVDFYDLIIARKLNYVEYFSKLLSY